MFWCELPTVKPTIWPQTNREKENEEKLERGGEEGRRGQGFLSHSELESRKCTLSDVRVNCVRLGL